MNDETPRDPILPEIEAFLGLTEMAPSAFGTRAIGDPTFVLELRRGRECKRATRARVRAFIARHASLNETL